MAIRTEDIIETLGQAALTLWPQLPHNTQQLLFEQAVAMRGEAMRHDLATFLHVQHPRTADAPAKARDVPEPDSLGG